VPSFTARLKKKSHETAPPEAGAGGAGNLSFEVL
jgi:hypothetical protein